MSSSWKKRRIHKRTGRPIRFRAGLAAPIACTIYTIDAYYTSWFWDSDKGKVTCLACLKKRPRA